MDYSTQQLIYEMLLQVLPRETRRKLLSAMNETRPYLKKPLNSKEIIEIGRTAFIDNHIFNERGFAGNKEGEFIYSTLGKDLPPEFIYRVWFKVYKSRSQMKAAYNKKPQKEGRDNKGVKVGSGYGNRNSIRWPKQTSNRHVWKNFWKLFPHLKGYKSQKEFMKSFLEQKNKE